MELNNRYYSTHACPVLHSALLTPTVLLQGKRTQESVKTVTTNSQETKKYYTSLLWSALLYTFVHSPHLPDSRKETDKWLPAVSSCLYHRKSGIIWGI